MKLFDYQETVIKKANNSWVTNKDILIVLPTGAGKTVVFSSIIADHNGYTCAIAHRQELVGQISLSLAKFGVRHNIIAPMSVIRDIIMTHVEELGVSYFDPTSRHSVAGVDTIIRRRELDSWGKKVTLWVCDEAHHFQKENKWGRAINLFPNAKGLGVTATPKRCDGKGLSKESDGIFQDLIEGPSMRSLIERGYLSDYRIFAPPNDLDLSNVTISKATGDFNTNKLAEAVNKSSIIGDVVHHYKKLANGKLGVTFCMNVEHAHTVCAQYNSAGVPAEVLSAKTKARDRIQTLRRFKNKEILQIVNVDILGEGFDAPAIEVATMLRRSESLAIVYQQMGRSLRRLEGKDKAIIIDHVNNVQRHGLPDANRIWSLEPSNRKNNSRDTSEVSIRVCSECTSVYLKVYMKCPYCGYEQKIISRNSPEEVEGDLVELSPEVLEKLRRERNRIDSDPLIPRGLDDRAVGAVRKNHRQRQEGQGLLRETIKFWSDYQTKKKNIGQQQAYRKFFHLFGIDVMTAQTLNRKDALDLRDLIAEKFFF